MVLVIRQQRTAECLPKATVALMSHAGMHSGNFNPAQGSGRLPLCDFVKIPADFGLQVGCYSFFNLSNVDYYK
jgi:hypothetical protein